MVPSGKPVGIERTSNGLKVLAGSDRVLPGDAALSGDALPDEMSGVERSRRNRAVPEHPLTHRSRTDGAAVAEATSAATSEPRRVLSLDRLAGGSRDRKELLAPFYRPAP